MNCCLVFILLLLLLLWLLLFRLGPPPKYVPVSNEILESWFVQRVEQIETECGNLQHCITLLELATDKLDLSEGKSRFCKLFATELKIAEWRKREVG